MNLSFLLLTAQHGMWHSSAYEILLLFFFFVFVVFVVFGKSFCVWLFFFFLLSLGFRAPKGTSAILLSSLLLLHASQPGTGLLNGTRFPDATFSPGDQLE